MISLNTLVFEMITFPLLVLTLSMLLVIYLLNNARKRPKNFPPGPPKLPLWGSYWFLLKEDYHHPHLSLEKLGKKYNTDIVGYYLGNTPAITTLTNKLSKEALTKEEFSGRPETLITKARSASQENKGIFFVEGQYLNVQRRFALRQLRDYGFGRRSERMESLVADEIKIFIDLITNEPKKCDKDICRKKGQLLMPDALYGPLLNFIFLLLGSCRFDNNKLRKVGKAAIEFQRSGDQTGNALNMTPWLRFIAPGYFGYTEAVKTNNVMLDICKEVIDEHLKSYSDDHCRDFVDEFIKEQRDLEARGIHNTTFTEAQLLIVLLDFMFAAVNALGHTLSFYTALLVNHPEVQKKIQKEIDDIVGRNRFPTLDDRPSMPYVEASIREAIRIWPLNPFGIVRKCMEDTNFAGYFIPKGTIVLPSFWAAHRDTSVWGDPENFRPERFLDENGHLLKKDYTMGFGAGRRLCAGETFARHNMFLIVSGLLQNFTLKAADGDKIDIEKNLVGGANISIDNNWIEFVPR